MRQFSGWIYREPGMGETPARLRVTVHLNKRKESKESKVFDDSPKGSVEAAEYITHTFGDSWKLEECGFLGYRIVVE